MPNDIPKLRDRILLSVLPMVKTEGWSWGVVQKAAQDCQVQDGLESIVFPNGLADIVAHFSDYIDRKTLEKLAGVPVSALRSKDKVRAAVMARYEILENYKGAVKSAVGFWAQPNHVIQGQRVLWRTSDRIWAWAGDTATDYNRQTKRAILLSILMGTTMIWLEDESDNYIITQAFLDRRLENVMEFGKVIGTMKKVIPNLFRQVNQST